MEKIENHPKEFYNKSTFSKRIVYKIMIAIELENGV